MLRNKLPVDAFLKKILNNSVFINKIILKLNVFPNFLYGSKFKENKNLLNVPFDLETKLLKCLNDAIAEVPFYKKKYKKLLSLNMFYENIGFTEKNLVLDNFSSFISSKIIRSDYLKCRTGGSTGKPMEFLLPKNRYNFELATVYSFWEELGWNYESRGVIRNHKLLENEIFKINPLTKEFIFDAFRHDDEYVRKIHSTLIKNKISYIQAYPSSAFLFCKICKSLGLDLSFIKYFFTSSEPVFDFQRKLIVEELGIGLFNFYGHSEKLIIAKESVKTGNFHFIDRYGFAELIDEHGLPILEEGQVGEIVGTSFNNPGMPLIRYRTGDFAEFVSMASDGLGLVVKNIEGHRDQNLIYKREGTFTSTTALNLHDNLLDYIDGLQYFQKEKGELLVSLIKKPTYTDDIEALFYDHFKDGLGNDCSIEIEYVDSLKIAKNGKCPLLLK